MAQTVALARSSATCFANGSTRATIFTNSASYTATRVIVNSFVVWNSTIPYYTNGMKCGGYLVLTPSGQKGAVLAQLPGVAGTSTQSVVPYSNANSPNGYTAPGSTTAFNPVILYAATTPTGPQPSFDSFTSVSSLSINTNYRNIFPANFYMGPSDVITWFPDASPSTYPKYSGYTTQTIYYNFTLIHES